MACACLLIGGPASSAGQPPETEPVASLLDAERFPDGWVLYSAEDTQESADTWMVRKAEGDKPAVLVCTGKPYGYIRTKETYKNYEIALEWNYPEDPNGNSGILVHTTGEDKIWPTSIQVQLHLPAVGSTFPSGEAQTANTLQAKNMKLAPKKWHRCRVRSEDGKITVFINGKKIGEVTGCEPSEGTIALQSEGSEIHFRKIRLQKLPDKPDDRSRSSLSEWGNSPRSRALLGNAARRTSAADHSQRSFGTRIRGWSCTSFLKSFLTTSASSAPSAVNNSGQSSPSRRRTRTEHGACRRTRSVTEPSTSRFTP